MSVEYNKGESILHIRSTYFSHYKKSKQVCMKGKIIQNLKTPASVLKRNGITIIIRAIRFSTLFRLLEALGSKLRVQLYF